MANLKTETRHVAGITCSGCEAVLEKILGRQPGVLSVSVDINRQTVTMTIDEQAFHRESTEKALKQSGYSLGTLVSEQGKSSLPPFLQRYGGLIGLLVVLGIVFFVVRRTVGFDVPEYASVMGYGALFVTGLLTSLHCVTMCGGIAVSQCVGGTVAGSSAFRPSLLYNAGRVVSYTVIGGVVGGLGAVISLTPTIRGVIVVLSGILVVLMGIGLTGLFPQIQRFLPRLPRSLHKQTAAARKGKGPFIVGLLNGFMPCGPLQAMQIYALGTGSFLMGASSMFFFALGTVPLMFAIGLASTLMSKRLSGSLVKVGAVLMLVLGIVMINRGLLISGIGGMTDGGENAQVVQTEATDTDVETDTIGVVPVGDVQVVEGEVTSRRYPKITVKKGVPVELNFKVADGALTGCNRTLVIPEYDIELDLQVGDNIVIFTPDEAGRFPYSCWMGMITSEIKVEE